MPQYHRTNQSSLCNCLLLLFTDCYITYNITFDTRSSSRFLSTLYTGLRVQGHTSTLDADALRMYVQLLDSESIISAISCWIDLKFLVTMHVKKQCTFVNLRWKKSSVRNLSCFTQERITLYCIGQRWGNSASPTYFVQLFSWIATSKIDNELSFHIKCLFHL